MRHHRIDFDFEQLIHPPAVVAKHHAVSTQAPFPPLPDPLQEVRMLNPRQAAVIALRAICRTHPRFGASSADAILVVVRPLTNETARLGVTAHCRCRSLARSLDRPPAPSSLRFPTPLKGPYAYCGSVRLSSLTGTRCSSIHPLPPPTQKARSIHPADSVNLAV